MTSVDVKTSKTETRLLGREDELEASIIRGIEDYKEGRATVCHNKYEALKHLKRL